jgi:hypothetical protein
MRRKKVDNTIESKFGLLRLAPTEKDHIHVTAQRGRITVNRVEYDFGAHMYRHADGRFHVGLEKESRRDRLWLKKADVEWKKATASDSAIKKVIAELEEIVNVWVEREPLTMVMAEKIYIQDAIKRREETLKELKEAEKEIKEELKRLRKGEHLAHADRFRLETTREKE